MTALRTYLKDQTLKQAEFASRVGLSQATVSRLASGSLKPSLAVALKIERTTGGAVLVSSWFDQADSSALNASSVQAAK